MGVISIVGKIVLVVVNIVLLLVSLVLLGLGAAVVAGGDFYNSLLDSMEDTLLSSYNSLGLTVDTTDFTLTSFMLPIAYVMIVLGIVVGGLAILGCIGGCYAIKIVLMIYAIVLGVIFAVQLIAAIIIYADQSVFDDLVKPHLKDLIKDFTGIEGTDKTTMAWNAIMFYEECCGVDDYQDFQGLTYWPPSSIAGNSVSLVTPVACCKTLTANDYSCAESPGATASTNNMFIGCYDKLFDLVMESTAVITVLVLFLAFQLGCLICAAVVYGLLVPPIPLV